jgi:DNA-binding transcriptional LysR family regulator
VTPTGLGRALLARGRAAFDELKQGMRDIEHLSDPASGELKVGCQEAIAAILPPVIASFSKRYPRVVLNIFDEEFDRYAGKLRDRSLDFILQRLRRYPSPGDPYFDDLDLEILFEDELVIVAGAETRFARRRKVELAELASERRILATPESWNDSLVSEAFRERERFPLKMLPVDLPVRPWPVAVLKLKNRSLSPVVQLFLDHIRSEIASVQS